jgi:hypothetical protein
MTSLKQIEEAIVSEYLPHTPVEPDLVHRLASLFWRVRRATSIETGLVQMQSDILYAFRTCRQSTVETRGAQPDPTIGIVGKANAQRSALENG